MRKKEFVPQSDDLEARLKHSIIGLVDKSEFQKIRESAEQTLLQEKASSKPEKKKGKETRLSFADEDEDEIFLKKAKKEEKIEISQEMIDKWKRKQEEIKQEVVQLKYSFWNSTNYRTIEVKKKTSIIEFLDIVRKEYKELKGISMDNILCIKDDLILPQHLTFYDLIVNEARGRYGLLFGVEKNSIEKAADLITPSETVRLIRIAERTWYEKHKGLHPANKWTPLNLDSLFKPLDLAEFNKC